MGSRTLPGGLLEYLRLTAPLEIATLNAGSASAADGEYLRVIESINMTGDGLTGECCAVGVQIKNNAGTVLVWGEWWNAMVNVTAVSTTPTAVRAFHNTPILWERGTTLTYYGVGDVGTGSAVVGYRKIPVSVAMDKFGYIPSTDGT